MTALRKLALPLFLLPIAAGSIAQTLSAPPIRDVPETFFGTSVPDPYRWLEDKQAPETAQWMKAAADQAQAALARIPGRQGLLERIQKYDSAASSRVGGISRETGDHWFFERRGASENQFKLVMRKGLQGTDKVLVDPDAIAKSTGKPHAINYYAQSPGGKYLAYGLSKQGSEDAVLHVIDTQSGKQIGKPIDRAQFGSVSWSPNGTALVFNRLKELKPGAPETEKYQKSQVYLLPLDGDIAKAPTVFGIGSPGTTISDAEIPTVSFTHDGKWALGYVINGTQREIRLYVSPAKALLAGKPVWQPQVEAADEVTEVTYMADKLYLRTHKDASRSRVLSVDVGAKLATATEIIPQSERVISGIAAAADALYVEARNGNIKQLFKRSYTKDAQLTEVKLPIEGSFILNSDEGGASAADPRFGGLVLDLQNWVRARQIYLLDPKGSVRNTGLQPKGPFDEPTDLVATEVKVKSHDGALVPLSIIHKKSVVLDGTNPTILYGYASYGITEEPYFSVSRLAWLDAGGVFAVANPRGSSVYGQDWYKAGFQATKPNTWKDFIACAEWLISNRWTSSSKLGIWGGSAGGILVGRAMTDRPDLFAAVVPQVGLLDAVRAEVTPNGVPNIPEFGTRTTEAGFKALLEMSTYHKIRDGMKYPAVLFIHGVNDPRVEVWQSTKTAARLAAATASNKPILLRLDYDAGHGIGSTKSQVLQERADTFAFFLWQMGVPDFQPK